MYQEFEAMPSEARVWVYQADRALNESEEAQARAALEAHCQQWAAHGQDLVASYQVFHHRFVVLAVDEQAHLPTGCSIDSSVAVIKALAERLGIDFFKRTDIIYRQPDGSLQTMSLSDIGEAIRQNQLTEQTPIFQNLVNTKAELLSNWEVAAGQSWLKRYFQNQKTHA